jgi:23S rRNA U2552 (ribose-2'-O)-methylase RlmE/FtsJ
MGRDRQNWRAFRPVMHLHENHYTKRAGVAGIRARVELKSLELMKIRGILIWHSKS